MTLPDVLLRLAIALPVGLVFGSFLTVAIHRVPAGESLVTPRSRCPSCGTPLRNVDNIPVISWVALRGRCHACRARISAVYPLTELACGALFVAVALVYEDPWQAVLLAPFSGLLVALSVIDVRHHRIPNVLVYPAVLVSAGFVVVADLAGGHLDALRGLLGFLAYGVGLLIVALIAPKGMGMGDVKLAFSLGLFLGWLGWGQVFLGGFLAFLLGALVGVALIATKIKSRKDVVPFGPFLALGAMLTILWGDPILRWYTGA